MPWNAATNTLSSTPGRARPTFRPNSGAGVLGGSGGYSPNPAQPGRSKAIGTTSGPAPWLNKGNEVGGGGGGRGGGRGGGGGGGDIAIKATGWRPEELEAHRKRTEANLESLQANETEAARQFRADMTDADAASLESMKEEAARMGVPFNVEEAMARLSKGRHRASAEQAVGNARAYTNALVGATDAISRPSGFEEGSRQARHGEGLSVAQLNTNRALAEQQMALQKLSTFISTLSSMSVNF